MAYSFSNIVIVADFYINQDYIAANLCVNKDKPWMHCNGKCQLCKKVETENKKDQSGPERKSENKVETLSANSFLTRLQSFSAPVFKQQYPLVNAGRPVHKASDIFHPPRT